MFSALLRSRTARSITQHPVRHYSCEPLEARRLLVVAAAAIFPDTVNPGSGFDGVVQVIGAGGAGTGTLLWTGRHVLTAAHVVDSNNNGLVDDGSKTVTFDLPGGDVVMTVPIADITLHNQYNGAFNQGSDIAIMTLPSIAPFAVERRNIYRGTGEVGEIFSFLGYGATNRVNASPDQIVPGPTGTIASGNFSHDGSFGTKRIGFNTVDAVQFMGGGSNVFDQALLFDFDAPGTGGSVGSGESLNAPGDSGGPLFVSGQIAGVSSGITDAVINYGDNGFYTRVSPFATWVDATAGGTFDLVIRMLDQPSGSDGIADTISFDRSGSALIVTFNGTTVVNQPIANVTSIRYEGATDPTQISVNPLGTSIPVRITGGGGYDSLTINGATGNNTLGSNTFAGGSHNFNTIVSVEGITLNGTNGNENFFINNRQFFDSVVYLGINGGDGADTCTIGQGELYRATQSITYFVFNGGNGSDVLTLNNSTRTVGNWNYGVANTYVDALTAGYYFQANYTSCSSLIVHGTPQGDTFVLPATLSPTAQLNGNDGSDNVILGGGNLTGVQPQVFNGGNGFDQITFDNHLDTTNRIWDMRNNEVLFGGLISLGTAGFESVGVLGGSGQDEFAFQGTLGQGFNIDGGSNTDTFILGYQGSVFFSQPVALLGGEGGDVFTVNDAAVSAFTTPLAMDGGAGFNSMTINQSAPVGFTIGDGYFSAGSNGTFGFANMLTTIFNGNANNNIYTIYSAGVFLGTVTINGNIGNDTFNLLPQPSGYTFKGLTLNGNQGVDTFTLNASALSTDENYTIGSNILQVLRGASTETVTTSSMDQITLTCGTGNDVIAMNQYSVGIPIAVNGGNGNDTLNFGGNHLAVNITSLAQFVFSGGMGFDRFNLTNGIDNGNWTYTRNNGSINASRVGYTGTTLFENTIEELTITAGPSNDTFLASGIGSGVHDIYYGANGFDSLQAGTSTGLVSLVSGPITFDAGTANATHGGVVNVTASQHSTSKIAHLTASTFGATPGDDFFGLNGSVEFFNITNMNLSLGNGADTVYARPLIDATVQISGLNPTTSPGDKLYLALADAQSPTIIGTGNNGSVTSTNLKTLSYNGFETGPVIDVAAPTGDVIDVSPDPRQTAVASIPISFSEAVTGLNLADLSLTRDGGPNLLTGTQTLTTSNNIDWTLGGLESLTAARGIYVLTLTAAGSGVVDGFGNALAENAADSWELILPQWLSPDSVANWDPATNTLTVAGVATLIANPGVVPTVIVDGPAAILTIDAVGEPQIHITSLILSNGASAVLAPTIGSDRVLVIEGMLSIDGRLDVTNNSMVLKGSSLSSVQTAIANAATGELNWTGDGITSSSAANDSTGTTAVGYATVVEFAGGGSTDFEGVALAGLSDDAVLVKFTYYGDADLSGQADLDDFPLFIFGLEDPSAPQTWYYGDYNYSGEVDLDDFPLFIAGLEGGGQPE